MPHLAGGGAHDHPKSSSSTSSDYYHPKTLPASSSPWDLIHIGNIPEHHLSNQMAATSYPSSPYPHPTDTPSASESNDRLWSPENIEKRRNAIGNSGGPDYTGEGHYDHESRPGTPTGGPPSAGTSINSGSPGLAQRQIFSTKGGYPSPAGFPGGFLMKTSTPKSLSPQNSLPLSPDSYYALPTINSNSNNPGLATRTNSMSSSPDPKYASPHATGPLSASKSDGPNYPEWYPWSPENLKKIIIQ